MSSDSAAPRIRIAEAVRRISEANLGLNGTANSLCTPNFSPRQIETWKDSILAQANITIRNPLRQRNFDNDTPQDSSC